mmetsp:Transcript_12876/g.18786  ORF Transcript_12876/g.18786 Transcript_12876/m.18786 type:complete len:249 (+) Transcript_12876:73-819(+)|eukprot:CAMPEP_0194072658 /NCGR_PEP_ID=MMETSP0149-20130528/337_1 /TAXON_ID=122233 /ORGANISM="Chaetoceros debilis, Strain MM31A-1" /LENGTH=248 /DNA_ID=CAMNT_0038752559 /DNA_START=59 /DNA_END=805 /DNA_ORIENTATION=+
MTIISFRTILTIMAAMQMAVSASAAALGKSHISQPEKSAKVRNDFGTIHEISNDRNQGRNLSVLSSFFQFVTAHHCMPGPLGDRCRKSNSEGGGGGSGSSGSTSGGSTVSKSVYYDGSGGGGSTSSASVYYDGSGGSSGGGGGGGNSANNSEGGGGGGSGGTSFSTGNALAIGGIVVAASVAIAAMYMGSRKRNADKRSHPLHGTLKKRMGMFGRLAQRSNCATCRPEDVKSAIVENGDVSGADYRLA